MGATIKKWSFGRVVMWIFLVTGAFFSIFPFVWMVIGTTQNPNHVVMGKLIPGDQFLVNWQKMNATYDIMRFFLNSLKIAVVSVVLGIFVNGLAAFGFEKYPSKIRDRIFAIFLLALIIPQMAIVIPLFKQVAKMGLLNTHTAIILP